MKNLLAEYVDDMVSGAEERMPRPTESHYDPHKPIDAYPNAPEVVEDEPATPPATFADMYGDSFEDDMAALERRGIARVQYGMIIQTEDDAAAVVGAVQSRMELAAKIRAQADELAQRAERDADRLQKHFEGQLKDFVQSQLTGKAKSIKIATGHGDGVTTLGFRHVTGALKIVDAAAALAWADETGEKSLVKEEVKTIRKPVAEAFKNYFKEMGEIPAGCEVTEDEEKFYIKTTEAKAIKE